MNYRLIAVSGNGPGAGKSEAVKYLETRLKDLGYDPQVHKLAKPIYDAVHLVCSRLLIDFDKNKLRPMMQFLGKFCRDTFGEDFWLDRWELDFKTHQMFSQGNPITLCDDVRYNNEAVAIKRFGGAIIHLVSDKATREARGIDQSQATHSSEAGIDPFFIHQTVYNNGTIEDLHRRLDYALELLGAPIHSKN